MEVVIRVRVEELPEGFYLATSEELPGLVAQGRTVAETLEIARDIAKKLIEARREREQIPTLTASNQQQDYTIVVGA
jgi:predicted RNase H-like HicB family nuclease